MVFNNFEKCMKMKLYLYVTVDLKYLRTIKIRALRYTIA